MAEQESVKSLNQLLQGEHMAVDSLNVFISKTEDEDVKKALQHLQNHHRENIAALAKYIQSLGGQASGKSWNEGYYGRDHAQSRVRQKS